MLQILNHSPSLKIISKLICLFFAWEMQSKLTLLDEPAFITTIKTLPEINDTVNVNQPNITSQEPKCICDEEYDYYLKITLSINDDNNIKFIKLSKTIFNSFCDDNNEMILMLSYPFSCNLFEIFKRYLKDKSIHLKIHKTKYEFRMCKQITLREFMEFIVTHDNIHFVQFSNQLFGTIFNDNITNHKDEHLLLYNDNLLELVRDYITKKKKVNKDLIETEKSICNKSDNSYEYKEDTYKKYEPSPELTELTKMVNKPRETVEDIINSGEYNEKYEKLISEGKTVTSIYDVMDSEENVLTENKNECDEMHPT